MRLSDINPKKKKKTVLVTVITLAVCLGGGLSFLFFPHLLNRQSLINVQYIESGKTSRVLTLYQETGSNEDDGTYLTGYWLYLMDPVTNKEISKLFIKRKDKNNNMPTNPDMWCINDKEIWLIGNKGIYAGDMGFISVINLNGDKLELASTPFLDGWGIYSSYVYDKYCLTVVNQFNETASLNMATHKIDTSGACSGYVETDSGKTSTSCFFFLKNTPTSTRGHLYYYECKGILPPPGIFAGMTQYDKVTPGWHLIDAVQMERGMIVKSTMDAYINQFDSVEKVTKIFDQEFLNNPKIILEQDGICVLSATDEANEKTFLYEFNSTGKMIWKLECPKTRGQSVAYGFNCIYKPEETIIVQTSSWAISIDNNTGKIKWQCPT